MKIAVNTRLLQEARMEGIARYQYESLKRIVLDHPEDTFYFIFDRPYSESFLFARNVVPIRLFPPTRHPFLILYWFEWAVKRTLDRLQPDLFFSGDTYLSLRTNVPTLLVSHDLAYIHYPGHIPLINRNYYRYFFPRFHRYAKKIIAVSEFTKSDIIQQYQISPEKITVAHNAPNGHFYPIEDSLKRKIREELTDGEPYFVYLGSIHPRKNLENLIKGFDQFKKQTSKKHKLLIIGRPAWNTASFYKTMEDSPYEADILHRQFKRKELPAYIGSAEALCYVSLFEGFGIPMVEGFEAEVPVITSNVSSMPEVAGKAAQLVDPRNPASIADAMTTISDDPELRKIMIEMGRERLNRFSWQKTADIIYGEMQQIVNDNR